jgi:hypothetical protein
VPFVYSSFELRPDVGATPMLYVRTNV